MKITKRQLEKLPTTGELGLFRKMLDNPEIQQGKLLTKHQMVEKLGVSGSQVTEYISRLLKKKLVEKEEILKPQLAYRPDAIKYNLLFSGNKLKDALLLGMKLRARYRVTCDVCGYSEKVLLPRMVFIRSLLRCPLCGARNRVREYIPLLQECE